MQNLLTLPATAQGLPAAPDSIRPGLTQIASNPAGNDQRVEFSELFQGALDHVSSLQETADQMRTDIEMGVSTDLVGTMIASEKSSLAFQSVVQVRNRIVSAYETVYNMPV